MSNSPDIIVVYSENLSGELFDNFKKNVSSNKLSLVVEAQPDEDALYACPEWFLPTVVAAYIGKSYFDGFLKEMGKDHFLLLKKSLSKLAKELMAKRNIEPTLVATEGKLNKKNPFSTAFSIYAETTNGYKFKLLVPKSSTSDDYSKIVDCFCSFLNNYYSGQVTLKNIGFNADVKPPSGYVFVHMNPRKESIEWLDEKDYK